MADLPEKIGKYHVVALAGRGSMGTVYTGYDPFTERDVAIKVCALEQGRERVVGRLARKLFFNEAHTAAGLDHPSIVKVLDAGEHEGEPYIVMEYIDGGETLQRYCGIDSLLPVRRVAEIVFRAAQALDYAHRRGVIHRDIKPTNLMLTRDGEVKICDFGIALRSLDDTTQIMGVVGTPRYMSREQIEDREVTRQTDLYSLGVVMYELLTGRPPHMATALPQLLHSISHNDPPPLRELRPELPESLDGIVRCAIARDPPQRYGSGREMASDLAAVFTDFEALQDDLDRSEEFDRLRGLRFFSNFRDDELWEVLRAGMWQTCSAGERILTEGSLGLAFFVIVSGSVAVRRQARVITRLSSGDCFGEMSYIRRAGRSATITAENEVVLLRLEAAAMDHLSAECQLRFNKEFVQTLVERLARADEVIAESGLGRHAG